MLAGLAALTMIGGCGSDSSTAKQPAAVTTTVAAKTIATVAPTATTPPVATTTTAAGAPATTAAGAPATTATISPKGLTWVPATVTIKVGGSVTFANPEGFQHTVASDTAGAFAGSDRATFSKVGATHTVTFSKAGVYAFHCELHGSVGGAGMSGSVTVV